MLNPHPPLSGMPFALLSVVIIFEILALLYKRDSLQSSASHLLNVLFLATIFTYFSGYWGLDHANKTFTVPESALERHQIFALLVIISLCPLLLFSLLKKRLPESTPVRISYYIFLLISFFLVTLTSFKGGELVFKYGAAVFAEKVLK